MEGLQAAQADCSAEQHQVAGAQLQARVPLRSALANSDLPAPPGLYSSGLPAPHLGATHPGGQGTGWETLGEALLLLWVSASTPPVICSQGWQKSPCEQWGTDQRPHRCSRKHQIANRAGKTKVKSSPTKPDNLILILEIHVVEGIHAYMCIGIHAYTDPCIYIQINK